MHIYFKIDPSTSSIIDVIETAVPLDSYVTESQGLVNGKPFIVEATVIDPPYDPATQNRIGPIDTYGGSPRVAKREYVIQDIPGLVAPPLTLDEEKNIARHRIDEAAERARARYVTPGSGQSMVYLEKARQVEDYIAAGYPADLTSYPLIQAEVNATGKSPVQAADDIVSIQSSWISKSAQIEEIRLKAKTDVLNAPDVGTVAQIADTAINTLDGV